MVFSANYRDLVAFLLALSRTLGWLVVVPPFSSRRSIPTLATVATGIGLAFLLAGRVPAAQIPTSTIGLAGAVVLEALTGIALGFLVALLVGTITAAGTFVDQMGGFNLPPSIDPLSLAQEPVLAQMYEQVMIVLLFVSGGYLVMVEGLARSFAAPPLVLSSLGRLSRVLVVDLGTYFLSALEMAAPLIAVLFTTQVVLGLLSRAAPQMNVWLLGLPLQIFLAVVIVAASFAVVPSLLTNVLTRALGDGLRVLGG